MTSLRLDIPPLYIPLPECRPHPDSNLLQQRGLDWLESLGLFTTSAERQSAKNTATHNLMAPLTPDAPADRTQLAVDWGYLMFALDDMRTDSGPGGQGTAELMSWFYDYGYALAHLETASLRPDRFFVAAADLSRRIRAITSPLQWNRWLTAHLMTSWGGLWESAQRNTSTAPTFNAYVSIRGLLAGTYEAITTAEIASANLNVPEAERTHPIVQAIVEASSLLIGLDDDLYSYPKEVWQAEQAGRPLTYEPVGIPILMRENKMDVSNAVMELVDIRNRIMSLLIRLHHLAKTKRFTADTQALVDIALLAVRSILEWAMGASRYTDPDGLRPNIIELHWGGITDKPPSNHDVPLPYPAIAWWWQQLA